MPQLIDSFEDQTPPSLAFIGYLEAILTDNNDGIHQYEENFGRSYMGVGAASLMMTALTSTLDHPLSVLMSVRYDYSGFTFSPSKRVSQMFLDDVIESLYGPGGVMDEDPEEGSFSASLGLRFPRTSRVSYLRGVASVVLSVLFMIEQLTQTPLEHLMVGFRRVYLEHSDD